MTQEEIKDIIIKNIGSDQYGFLYREIETAELIYSLHLKSKIEMLEEIISNMDGFDLPSNVEFMRAIFKDTSVHKKLELESQLTKIEKE